MYQEESQRQSDFGTGKKKFSTYILGTLLCTVLTIISFVIVMKHMLPKWEIFTVIYSAACIQFIVQVVCFLRLNTLTEQGRINVMSIIFTSIILLVIVFGSLWIMSNLNYNMM